jgi:hypothetical protein
MRIRNCSIIHSRRIDPGHLLADGADSFSRTPATASAHKNLAIQHELNREALSHYILKNRPSETITRRPTFQSIPRGEGGVREKHENLRLRTRTRQSRCANYLWVRVQTRLGRQGCVPRIPALPGRKVPIVPEPATDQ